MKKLALFLITVALTLCIGAQQSNKPLIFKADSTHVTANKYLLEPDTLTITKVIPIDPCVSKVNKPKNFICPKPTRSADLPIIQAAKDSSISMIEPNDGLAPLVTVNVNQAQQPLPPNTQQFILELLNNAKREGYEQAKVDLTIKEPWLTRGESKAMFWSSFLLDAMAARNLIMYFGTVTKTGYHTVTDYTTVHDYELVPTYHPFAPSADGVQKCTPAPTPTPTPAPDNNTNTNTNDATANVGDITNTASTGDVTTNVTVNIPAPVVNVNNQVVVYNPVTYELKQIDRKVGLDHSVAYTYQGHRDDRVSYLESAGFDLLGSIVFKALAIHNLHLYHKADKAGVTFVTQIKYNKVYATR